VSLSTDFLAAARLGDWVEAHVEIERLGQRMAFASCRLRAGERVLLRASGAFAVSPTAHREAETAKAHRG